MSVNALAKAWEWHRQTANNFLDELQDLGMLSFYTESLSTFIKLKNIVEVSNPTSVAAHIDKMSDILEE